MERRAEGRQHFKNVIAYNNNNNNGIVAMIGVSTCLCVVFIPT